MRGRLAPHGAPPRTRRPPGFASEGRERHPDPGRRSTPRAAATGRAADYIFAIIAWPKPEHDTCVAPGMSRAKS